MGKGQHSPCCVWIAILSFAILLRVLVGLHPHSGQDDYQGGGNIGIDNSNDSNTSGKTRYIASKYGGDYEAQRHWMEITYHLPIGEWYYHDLEYWGLDYPPLTAYVSYACGWVAHNVGSLHDNAYGNSDIQNFTCEENDNVCYNQSREETRRKGLGVLKDLVALYSSRYGFEEPGGKLYMRLTVLVLDLLVYVSAVWTIASRLTDQDDSHGQQNDSTFSIPTHHRRRIWLLFSALSQPALILIDHGHFQYNTVSLGLALWSFHFMTLDSNPFLHQSKGGQSFVGPIIGSILFSLALNFKQMELYHAPAVFAYLLGKCFRDSSTVATFDLRQSKASNGTANAGGENMSTEQKEKQKTRSNNTYSEAARRFCSLGITVILTFAVLWLPFALYPRRASSMVEKDTEMKLHVEGIVQVIRRLFPFQRGLFEGKVSNIWCALSVKPFSIKNRVPQKYLPLAALGLTLVLILPPCWVLFMVGKNCNSNAGNKNYHDAVQAHDNQSNSNHPISSQQNQQNHKENVYRFQKGESDHDFRCLLWGSASTSLAFFLASFQVHEKGILIPLAPLSLLAIDAPRFVFWFSIVATWSLWPLLLVDRLSEAYVCCLVIFICLNAILRDIPLDSQVDILSSHIFAKLVPLLSWVMMILLHIMQLVYVPPQNLPDLFPVLWSLLGCGLFCLSYLGTMWYLLKATSNDRKGQILASRLKKGNVTLSLIGVLCLSVSGAHSFQIRQHYPKGPRKMCFIHEFSSYNNCNHETLLTPKLLERAEVLLPWEQQEVRESKPILNLSARDPGTLSLADEAKEFGIFARNDNEKFSDKNELVIGVESWRDGHLWKKTEKNLMGLRILRSHDEVDAAETYNCTIIPQLNLTSDRVLSEAPQLIRIPTKNVMDSADFFLSNSICNGKKQLIGANFNESALGWSLASLLQMDPSLLTFQSDDLKHGLEYMSNMMTRGNQTLALQLIHSQHSFSPTIAAELFRRAVESGIDERRISRALGNASKSSSKAIETIASDIGKNYRDLLKFEKGKGS